MSAFWIRTNDLAVWRNEPHRAFFNGQPLLINFDGYYYLSLARELLAGEYGKLDLLRGVPDHPANPVPPPLISLIAAGIAAVTPFSLNWIGVFLPPLLGLSLAWPLYLIGRLYGGRLMALVAVCMALFTDYFAYRSHLGWFDTDCLNVTFVFIICYLFIRFGLSQDRKRYSFLAAGIGCFLFFLWWWDQTPALVTLISLSPLAIVLLLYYRPSGKERWAAVAFGALCLIGILVWKGPQILISPFQEAAQQWSYIAKQHVGDFPNVGVSVVEQKRLGLTELVKNTTGHWLSFGIGLAGLVWLSWQQKRRAAAFIIPFALGILSFLFARRFLIFLNPFLAIGFGFFAQKLWQMRTRWSPLQFITPVFIFIFISLPFIDSARRVYWPKEIPPIIEGMDVLARTTAKDAVVWTWWDHGYPMMYWSDRATINDGSLHGGIRTVCNAIPMVTQEPRLAANFMYFYVNRGIAGVQKVIDASGSAARAMKAIKDILGSVPEKVAGTIENAGLLPVETWRTFFFPESEREIYLFLDLRIARTTYWWSWFGNWDAEKKDGIHAAYLLSRNCRRNGDTIVSSDLMVDFKQGTATYKSRTHKLKEAIIKNGPEITAQTFDNPNGLVFIYDQQTSSGSLSDQVFVKSLFSRLFLFGQSQSDYFSLKSNHFPYYQIWRVNKPS